MDKVLSSIDKIINILQTKLNLSTESQYVVIDELNDSKEVFRGSWDECTDYLDEHTPDESNIKEFKFNIIESE